jgi:hypothetical protein
MLIIYSYMHTCVNGHSFIFKYIFIHIFICIYLYTVLWPPPKIQIKCGLVPLTFDFKENVIINMIWEDKDANQVNICIFTCRNICI